MNADLARVLLRAAATFFLVLYACWFAWNVAHGHWWSAALNALFFAVWVWIRKRHEKSWRDRVKASPEQARHDAMHPGLVCRTCPVTTQALVEMQMRTSWWQRWFIL